MPRTTFRERNYGKLARPTYKQALNIIRKFGGETRLARMLGISRIAVYKWNYRQPYGLNGLVPKKRIEQLRHLARMDGILLTDADWALDKYDYPDLPKIEDLLS